MFIIILFTAILGAMTIILFQLKKSANTGPTTHALQKIRAKKEEQKKRMNDMFMRWGKEAEEKKRTEKERLDYLQGRLPADLTQEEKNELADMIALSEHDEAVKMSMTFLSHSLYSQTLVDEYTAVRDASNCYNSPLALGLWLSNQPNIHHMIDAMQCYMRVQIGTVIVWRYDTVRNDLFVSYVMVRVNTPYRWIHLKVTRYENDSCHDILANYLKTLDAALFVDQYPQDRINPTNKLTEWMMWDTTTLKSM